MAKKSNVATVLVKNKECNAKFEIESDTIINIETITGGKFEHLRVTGINRMGNCIRSVSKTDGIVEVPLNVIKSITEVNPDKNFPGVKRTELK